MKSIVDLISYIGKQKNGVENDGIDFMTLKISSMKLLQNSYNANVTSCRISAARDVTSCRISAPVDGTWCRISASLDVTTCIVHILNVQRILGTFTMFNKPCSGKWNIFMGKVPWHFTVRWIKQSFALLKRLFSILRENRSISGAIIYETFPCFCLDSATLRSPFL